MAARNWAMIQGGVVVNVCIWDGVAQYATPPGVTMCDMAEMPDGCTMGWTQADQTGMTTTVQAGATIQSGGSPFVAPSD